MTTAVLAPRMNVAVQTTAAIPNAPDKVAQVAALHFALMQEQQTTMALGNYATQLANTLYSQHYMTNAFVSSMQQQNCAQAAQILDLQAQVKKVSQENLLVKAEAKLSSLMLPGAKNAENISQILQRIKTIGPDHPLQLRDVAFMLRQFVTMDPSGLSTDEKAILDQANSYLQDLFRSF